MAEEIPPIDEAPENFPENPPETPPIEAPEPERPPETNGREPGSDDVTEAERLEVLHQHRDEREAHVSAAAYYGGLSLEALQALVAERKADRDFATQCAADLLKKGDRDGYKFQNTAREITDELGLIEAAIKRKEVAQNGARVKQGAFWPEVLTAKQLLNLPPDPTRWVWMECLPVRATSVLVAKPYVGKSTFAACLALAVARGADFLGRPTQKGAALYVYLDGPLDELKENLTKLGMTEFDQVFTYGGRRPDKQIEWVTEKVKKYDVKLLIVDTMQKFFGFQKSGGEAYEERINKTQPLLDQVNDNNFHALFTCHAAKNSADNMISALGTVGTEANARVSLYLRKIQDSTSRTFQTLGNAGKNFSEIAISDPSEGFIVKTGSRQDAEIEICKPKILEFLAERSERVSERDIAAALTGQGRIKSLTLRALEKAGEVDRKQVMGSRGRKLFGWGLTGRLFEGDPEPKADEPKKQGGFQW